MFYLFMGLFSIFLSFTFEAGIGFKGWLAIIVLVALRVLLVINEK